jgi:hypothetical protein
MVKISFPLLGCKDQLAAVDWKVKPNDTAGADVYVSAFNVATQASENVKCAKLPAASYELTIREIYGQLNFHYLGTGVTENVSVK